MVDGLESLVTSCCARQDKVPPFPTEEAMRILARELGEDVTSLTLHQGSGLQV